jgi:hypothetical protein
MTQPEKPPRRLSKKQIILDYCRAAKLEDIGQGELRAVRDELRRRLGPADKTSLGYVASVLRAAGYQVQYEDGYSDSPLPDPYAARLKGVLEFHDLASAKSSLLKLAGLYRGYQSAGDLLGSKLVYRMVKKGKLRAQALAANPHVQEQKRREKQEIAHWFQVWLETPDLIEDWLALRKSSEEFRELFGAAGE